MPVNAITGAVMKSGVKPPKIRKKPEVLNPERHRPWYPRPNRGVCHISSLPSELIHEICTYLSPWELIRFVTCGRREFWKTAAGDHFRNFVWQRLQMSYDVPIPNPPRGWTQFGFFRFMFGHRPCQQCGTLTYEPSLSIAGRAIVCENKDCKKDYNTGLRLYGTVPGMEEEIAHWLPPVEPAQHRLFGGLRPNRGKKLYNPKTIAEAEAEYHRLADDPEAREILYAQRRLKLPGYLMDCAVWAAWRDALNQKRETILRFNTTFLRTKCKNYGWKFRDVRHATAMARIMSDCIERCERIEDKTFFVYYAIAAPTIDRKRDTHVNLSMKYGVPTGKGCPPLPKGAENTVRCRLCGEKSGRPFSINGLRSHAKMKHKIKFLEEPQIIAD